MRAFLVQICVIFLVGKSQCKDITVQLSPKTSASSIGKTFISYSISSKSVLQGFLSSISSGNDAVLKQLSPAFLKIDFQPKPLYSQNQAEVESASSFGMLDLKAINEWSHANGVHDIFQIAHGKWKWSPKDTMNFLETASELKIDNCSWQLGLDLDANNTKQYVRDFKALEKMVQLLPSKPRNIKLLAAPFNSNFSLDKTRGVLSSLKDSVDAFSWSQVFLSSSIDLKDAFDDQNLNELLKSQKKIRFFLNFHSPKPALSGLCDRTCVQEGLLWARLIGESAIQGFDAIFKPLQKVDLVQLHFKSLVDVLFKQLVGTKVLDMTKSSRLTTSYAFCGTDPGSVVLLVVNSDEETSRIRIKIPHETIFEYVIEVSEGKKVLLNGELPQLPLALLQRNSSRAEVEIPASSVGFFVLPDVNFSACKSLKSDETVGPDPVLHHDAFSSERVLLRNKRNPEEAPLDIDQIDVYPYLIQAKPLEGAKPEPTAPENPELTPEKPRKFKKVFTRSLFRGQRHMLPPPPNHFPFHHHSQPAKRHPQKLPNVRIPGIDIPESSAEHKVFHSSENKDFPRGEMTLGVGKKSTEEEPDYEYVQFEESTTPVPKKKTKGKKTAPTKESLKVRIEEADEDALGHDFGGEFATRQEPQEDQEELELLTMPVKRPNTRAQTKVSEKNVKYAVLVKELPPTTRQEQINLRKAQKKVDNLQLGDQETASEEADEADEEEVDYTNEEDERFFNSDEEDDGQTDKAKRQLPSFRNVRFISAVGKLLRKMERIFATANELEDDRVATRRRRTVDSVQVPRRRMRKDIAQKVAKKSKEVPKMEPLDIQNVAEMEGVSRVRRSPLVLASNELEKLIYEVSSNDLERDQIEIDTQLSSTEAAAGNEGVSSTTEAGVFEVTSKRGPRIHKKHIYSVDFYELLKPFFEVIETITSESIRMIKKVL